MRETEKQDEEEKEVKGLEGSGAGQEGLRDAVEAGDQEQERQGSRSSQNSLRQTKVAQFEGNAAGEGSAFDLENRRHPTGGAGTPAGPAQEATLRSSRRRARAV